MKLHGWTDAFQRYFHSFYRKKKIKLGNRRIHTKSIYFVDLNQDFSRKMSIMLRIEMWQQYFLSFYRKDEIKNVNFRTPTKAIYFLQGVCRKRQRWKKYRTVKRPQIKSWPFTENVKLWWDVTVCVMKIIFQCGTMKIIYSRIHTCTPLLRFKQDS